MKRTIRQQRNEEKEIYAIDDNMQYNGMKSTAVNMKSPAHLSLSSEFLCVWLFEQRQLLNILWEINRLTYRKQKITIQKRFEPSAYPVYIDSVQCVGQKTLSLFANVYVISEKMIQVKAK